jgi:PKD repeat protein
MDNRIPNIPSRPSGPTEGNIGQSFTYTTSSSDPDGDDIEYLFNWDDGTDSGWGSSSASHAWSDEGTYQVKAKCRDDWDESGWSDSLSVVISGGPQVNADGPYYANVGDLIQFEGSASGGDPPYTWFWNFGDGDTSTQQNPTHTYSEPGLHDVILVVTDSLSNEGSDTTYAYIGIGGGNPSPNANGPYTGHPGENIQFTGSVINGTSPYSWHWDFGDGNSSTEQNPIHAYSTEDTYTVVLNVEDFEGKTGTDTTTATIEAIILEPDLGCQGSLNWADIKPGVTVTGSFTVSNVGDPETLLNWEISEYPEWGSWTFTPESGIDLTPEDGSVTIEVTVAAPDEKDTEFSGSVIIENTDDSSDNCEISVSLVTPKYKLTYLFWQFMQHLIDRFPFLESFIDLR